MKNKKHAQRFLTCIFLLWEQAAPTALLAASFPGVYSLLALMGVFDALGDPWRLFVLFLCLTGAGFVLWRRRRYFTLPSFRHVDRRLEEDSGFACRPLEALHDEAVQTDSLSRALWRRHQALAQTRIHNLRLRPPYPSVIKSDSYALGAAFLLALCLLLFFMGAKAPDRLLRAFQLTWLPPSGTHIGIEAWIEPPSYTGQPPLFLTSEALAERKIFEVPQHASFTVRFSGTQHRPSVHVRGEKHKIPVKVTPLGETGFEAHFLLTEHARVRLSSAGTHRAFTLKIREDTPPHIAFAETPSEDKLGALLITYTAQDDYGLEKLTLNIKTADQESGPGEHETYPLEILAQNPKQITSATTRLNLVDHIWAGQKVELRLVAHDTAGQRAESAPVIFRLPERLFLQPLAKAIIEQRRLFMDTKEEYAPLPSLPALTGEFLALRPVFDSEDQSFRRLGRAPQNIKRFEALLSAVMDAPEIWSHDTALYLGLTHALARLRRAENRRELDGLEKGLWQMALRAELGSLADAQTALDEAEKALKQALALGASWKELQALMKRYQDSVERYFELLKRRALKEGRYDVTKGAGSGGGVMKEDQISELLKAIEETARLGQNRDARQAVARLTEKLRRMQLRLMFGEGEGNGTPPPLDKDLAEALDKLADVIARQRELMGEKFPSSKSGEGQKGQAAQAPRQEKGGGQQARSDIETSDHNPSDEQIKKGGAPRQSDRSDRKDGSTLQGEKGADSLRQEKLAEQAQGLARALEEKAKTYQKENAGDNLDKAARAMRKAARALKQGQKDMARADQAEALESLRQAAENLSREALAELDKDGKGRGKGETVRGDDPLGRGSSKSQNMTIPDQKKLKRSREILDEIRRRASEQDRSGEERDYLERLLERF